MEEIGTELMVLHMGAMGNKKIFMRNFEKVLKRVKLKIAIENEPAIYPKTQDVIEMVEEIGEERVGICIDVGHAFIYDKDIVESIRKSSGLLIATHISDNDGQNDTHNIPGEGAIDWGRVIKALKDVGYSGDLTYELYDPSGGKAPVRELKEFLIRVRTSLRGIL
jgi:sugar phosphate isomerase/epimerase